MRTNKIENIYSYLAQNIKNPKTELKYRNPYTFLVSVVLSAQATDKSVNAATKDLFKIAPTPKKMYDLGEKKIYNHIKQLGLAKTKAKNTYKKMRFSLFLVDLFVCVFYFSKGFLGAKIKAELEIRNNKKFIKNKFYELEKRKTVSDKDLIKNFPDKIFVPVNVSQESMNQTFNSILAGLSKRVKKKLI